jgi:hypothetical protein
METAILGSERDESAPAGTALADRLSEDVLAAIRERLHPEGLLVANARAADTPELMEATGFRPIGWDPSGIVVARLTNAVARRTWDASEGVLQQIGS